MKKIFKIIFYFVLSLIVVIVLAIFIVFLKISVTANSNYKKAAELAGREVRIKTSDGFLYRDLNKNNQLDIYEDKRRTVDERVYDLLSQMTLEEKVGSMFVPAVSMNNDGTLSEKPSLQNLFSLLSDGTSVMVFKKHINHLKILNGTAKKEMAIWYNNIQKMAEHTRLGIPVTIALDAMNRYSSNPFAGEFCEDISIWPDPIGLDATGDSSVVFKFANIRRQEYLAVGVREVLHPTTDFVTKSAWRKVGDPLGEDQEFSARQIHAYIKGFQGDSLEKQSVAYMIKYSGAIGSRPADKMHYYGVRTNMNRENAGYSFGVICTDWGIISDRKILGITLLSARAPGMEKVTPEERMLKVIQSGVDQFGGESIPEMLIQMVMDKKVSESRIDSSVRRILKIKFQLGLFDDPFVNVENAVSTVGKEEFVQAGMEAQRKSIVMLKNDSIQNGRMLPLKKGLRIYVENIDPAKIVLFGRFVKNPEDADVAIIRLRASGKSEKTRILKILNSIPTIVDIYIDRPEVIPEIALASKAFLVSFGSSDVALMDVIFGNQQPYGRLPLELYSTTRALNAQPKDISGKAGKLLFPSGFGITF